METLGGWLKQVIKFDLWNQGRLSTHGSHKPLTKNTASNPGEQGGPVNGGW